MKSALPIIEWPNRWSFCCCISLSFHFEISPARVEIGFNPTCCSNDYTLEELPSTFIFAISITRSLSNFSRSVENIFFQNWETINKNAQLGYLKSSIFLLNELISPSKADVNWQINIISHICESYKCFVIKC